VRKPRDILVANTGLGIYKGPMKTDLLLKYQLSDPTEVWARKELKKDPTELRDKYMLIKGILYCRNDTIHPY
jgi:hypothetical protein